MSLEEENVEVFDAFEVGEESMLSTPTSYNEHFSAWLESTDMQEDEFSAVLYKMSGKHSNKNRVFCKRYNDEVPEPEEVGEIFGAGRYKVMITFPAMKSKDKKLKTYTFTLHDFYDRNKMGIEQPQQPQQPQQTSNTPEVYMSMMNQVFGMVQNMIQPMLANQQIQQPKFNPAEMMGEFMGSMMPTFGKMAEDQMSMITDMAKKQIGLPVVEASEEEESFLSSVLPMIKEFLPYLTEQNQATQAVTAKMVQQTKQYKMLKSNNALLGRLVQDLVKTEGEEKVKKLLEKLNLDKNVAN